ncbi:MAG: helix-turn-helix transcriptional regulator [Rhizobiaceae bacterium]|nr:helix-turn-helix transcriptional regulator [Rhizobiaceae bacterium]
MDRLTHHQIWSAIDQLAVQSGFSVSGLAKKAGLDPTTFNKSKRFTSGGRERWPSTESIAKILKCTNTSVQDFMGSLINVDQDARRNTLSYRDVPQRSVPLIGFAQAGAGGYFDDGGFPVGQGWDEIAPPGNVTESSYALKVSGDSMMPLYREGDILVVDPTANVRRGDRVIVKTNEGEVLAKTLEKKSPGSVELKSLNPEHPDLKYQLDEIDWIARIVWASQ